MPTVNRQLALGFGAVLAATGVTAVVALGALLATSKEKDDAARQETEAVRRVAELHLRAEQIVTAGRGYLLTAQPMYLERFRAANSGFASTLDEVAPATGSRREADLLEVRHAWSRYVLAADTAVQRRTEQSDEAIVPYFEGVMSPARDALEKSLDSLQRDEREEVTAALERSGLASRQAAFAVAFTTLVAFSVSLWLSGTTRHRLSEQFLALGAATARATAAAEARDELLAVVSHDLRNPTTAILMNTALALRRLPPTGPRVQLERVHAAALRMRHLIEELLETARIDHAGLTLSRQRCELGPLVAEVVELFEPLAEAKQVTLTAQVPEAPCPAFIDRDRITRVLSNLCANAVKFTPAGGGVKVTVEREGDGALRCSVSDTGPGVPPDELERLFEKHWQARREGSDGLGLGLYIARSLVQAHGGRIWATSTSGQGATFTFQLPAV
jgi:signal transduction histidine kinase